MLTACLRLRRAACVEPLSPKICAARMLKAGRCAQRMLAEEKRLLEARGADVRRVEFVSDYREWTARLCL